MVESRKYDLTLLWRGYNWLTLFMSWVDSGNLYSGKVNCRRLYLVTHLSFTLKYFHHGNVVQKFFGSIHLRNLRRSENSQNSSQSGAYTKKRNEGKLQSHASLFCMLPSAENVDRNELVGRNKFLKILSFRFSSFCFEGNGAGLLLFGLFFVCSPALEIFRSYVLSRAWEFQGYV